MAVAVGQEFWIVAAKTKSAYEKAEILVALKNDPVISRKGKGEAMAFAVPDSEPSLTFGSFDNLIRLTDDLHKADAAVDTIVHRLERQWLEIDPRASLRVRAARQEKTFLEYLQSWYWMEDRYPKSRSIQDNLHHLMTSVTKIDDEARNKTVQFNEFKTQKANLLKKEGVSLPNRDLIDVLTPDIVKCRGFQDDDYVHTYHMTTVFVIVPRGLAKEFTSTYETLSEHVVPGSAMRFSTLDDKEGNSLWRVVLFKGAVEEFKKHCRERRFVPRDFEYNEEAYRNLMQQRQEIDAAMIKHQQIVMTIYQASWSDAMVAWMHIKAMRVFVESVLRFGIPPQFGAYIISPTPGTQASCRKALTNILGKYSDTSKEHASQLEAGTDEGEEYFPYVSFTFTPFTTARVV